MQPAAHAPASKPKAKPRAKVEAGRDKEAPPKEAGAWASGDGRGVGARKCCTNFVCRVCEADHCPYRRAMPDESGDEAHYISAKSTWYGDRRHDRTLRLRQEARVQVRPSWQWQVRRQVQESTPSSAAPAVAEAEEEKPKHNKSKKKKRSHSRCSVEPSFASTQ